MKDRSVNSKYTWEQVEATVARREPSPPKKNREGRDTYPLKLPERFDIRRARRAQSLLSQRITIPDRSELDDIELVAGVDVAYWEDLCFSAAVVVRLPNLIVTEVQSATCKNRFPYVPTLLAYRECPAIIRAIEKLRRKADIYMFDGHGLAHPLKLGLASHLGVVLGIRSIGVAKNLLHGATIENEKHIKTIRMNGKLVGVSIESGFKPIYVSVGNLISLQDATELVKCCIRGSRLPEPLRIAHKVATGDREKRKERQQLDAVSNHHESGGRREDGDHNN